MIVRIFGRMHRECAHGRGARRRIAGEERKKLKDIAAALQIPEIHFGAILEDLALWLAKARSE